MPPSGNQGQLNRAVAGPLQRLVIRRVAGLVRRPAMAACGAHERCAPTPGRDDCELPAVWATKYQKLREHERESPTKGKEVPGFRGQAEDQKEPAKEGNREHQHAPLHDHAGGFSTPCNGSAFSGWLGGMVSFYVAIRPGPASQRARSRVSSFLRGHGTQVPVAHFGMPAAEVARRLEHLGNALRCWPQADLLVI